MFNVQCSIPTFHTPHSIFNIRKKVEKQVFASIEHKRFQNKVAESRWSALRTSIIALVIWLAAGLRTFEPNIVISFVCIAMTAIMMGQLNSTNALIRIYSRMIMCSYLAITSVATFLFADISPALVTLCAAICYTFLFCCYQDKNSPGWIFYAYLALGLASVFWVQALFFLPFLWIVTATNLLAMNFRNFIASLLGVITPYWFTFAWYAFTDNVSAFVEHFTNIISFGHIANLSVLTTHELVTFAFIILLAVTGMLHFANKAHQDNIRTRLLYETFIAIDALTLVFIILQPQQFRFLYGILAVNTAPLIGHFIALTHTKWTNWYFIFLLVLAVVICAYNIWIP